MRKALVDFAHHLREWDGFGVNYVESCQTRDYAASPQDYGAFSTLSEPDRQHILDLIFGDDGLKPSLVKMFLDPFHQGQPDSGYNLDPHTIDPTVYNHAATTRWMRYFVHEGLARTRARGDDLAIITSLYGPPAWVTKQRFLRGRDLDPEYKYECAKYMIAWIRYLREEEHLPVKYISLHNEGEDWMRWPLDGSDAGTPNHDYNLFWPPAQVVDFLRFMRDMLDRQGLEDVGITPGETTNWYRFYHYGYADAIAADSEALAHLGLITSHGFYHGEYGRRFGDHRSVGSDILKEGRPDLHSWVTSTSWSNMDVFFLKGIYNNMYAAKANAIIPWAIIQRTDDWIGGDPNPGTAFRADGLGHYTVEPGYYFFKQVCCAGEAGMAVARVACNDPGVVLIAFASNGTSHPDAFVLLNLWEESKLLDVEILGGNADSCTAYRTAEGETYVHIGDYAARGVLTYEAPAKSATTFVGASA